MKARGFTLVECLIGTAVSLFVVCAALEFLASAQKHFRGLNERAETAQAAWAALDRMKIDLLHAGRGLAGPAGAGLVEAAEATVESLTTTSLDGALILTGEARAGDLRLSVATASGLSAGREICLFDGRTGEVRTVARVEAGAVVLREPLESGYEPATAAVSLLERVAYFVDRPARILRRRVNASSAQPLLENAAGADWQVDREAGLVRVRLEVDGKGENVHELCVFLKNAALARFF